MTFEQELERYGSFVFTSAGSSMRPLIVAGRDILTIRKRPEGRLKKYDIPLYKSHGKYVLHRILKVRENDYVIAGDHSYHREYVTEDQILGILIELTRDGKRRALSGALYRIYLFFWCDLYPLRAAILFMISKARRCGGRRKRAIKEGRG